MRANSSSGCSSSGAIQDASGPPQAALRVHGGCVALASQLPPGWEALDSHVLGAAPKARLSPEERLEREVSRRRQEELDRRARIFDAKRRLIGVDKDCLDRQVQERALRQNELRATEQQFDGELLRNMKGLHLMEKEKAQARRGAEKELIAFGRQQQSFESRREFDLNDPKSLAKSLPVRIGDDDPRLGPASLQQFAGEDLDRVQRSVRDRNEFVSGINVQLDAKAVDQQKSAEARAADDSEFREIVALRAENEEKDNEQRKQTLVRNQAELLETARVRAEMRRAEEEAMGYRDAMELEHHANDPFLNELRTDVGGARDRYKGSTQTERMEARKDQEKQACEDRAKQAQHSDKERQCDKDAEAVRKRALLLDREKARQKRQAATAVAGHNAVVQVAAKDKKQQDSACTASGFAQEFFEQFGVSCR